jgi:transmembrane sensor
MGNKNAENLIKKYLEGTANPEEEALLESWYIETAQAQPVMCGTPDYRRIADEVWGKVKPPIRLWPRAAAVAAAVLIILAIGTLFIPLQRPAPRIVQRQPLEKDILPAGARATLTLLDGRTITVDSANNGPLARQDDATISSLDGRLIYSGNRSDQSAEPGPIAYNTLTTSPGEHYSLLLPDGTKAWLNAASSITYPVVFNGNERKVSVTGEVYFEIVHNAKQPFEIRVKNELVEDIGTHLNINSYDDEAAINTTLLEGSIKLTKGSASAVLEPGQQATIQPGGNSFELKQVDADEAIAWKNGYFYFDRADIHTVMRQVARWYNVQVVYKGEIPKRTFKGKVYRNINASEALGILSYFGAHFRIEGKMITVSS